MKKKKTAVKANKTQSARAPWVTQSAFGLMALGICVGAFLVGKNQRLHTEAMQLTRLVETAPGVSVQAVGGTVFLRGELNSIVDFNQVRGITTTLKNSEKRNVAVVNLTELSAKGKNLLLADLKKELKNPRVKARFVNNRLILEGTVRNDFDADRAVEVAKALLQLGAQGTVRETAAATQPATNRGNELVILDMIKTTGR